MRWRPNLLKDMQASPDRSLTSNDKDLPLPDSTYTFVQHCEAVDTRTIITIFELTYGETPNSVFDFGELCLAE